MLMKTGLRTLCTQAGERCRIATRTVLRNENSSAFVRYRTDAPPIITHNKEGHCKSVRKRQWAQLE